ncbi:hypothetical protein RHMOL_Rhmol09G0106800 [Rhododendron molle]|uniref:Uncharacterized protein n=1 Tax=Rhododendron molle TaxID=49168 RepID=A0ACC0MCJ3_RHOML|nr:hypothetical protein RHMOL_Rhmol09G0106800 [Rhododendron molle]
MVRKKRELANLRLAVGGLRRGHIALLSSSYPIVLSKDSQPHKKQQTDVTVGGEGRREINYGDCVGLSSSVVYGILRAGSLLRDVNEAPKELASLISEIAQYLVLFVAMREAEDAVVVEHEQAQLAWEAASKHQKNFDKSEGLRKDVELRAQKAKEELAALKSQVQLQVDAADQKGYDEGYDKATLEYKVQVRDIVADIYYNRFKAGAKWYHKHLMATLNPSESSYIRTLPEHPAELLKMSNLVDEEQRAEPNDKPESEATSKIDPNRDAQWEASRGTRANGGGKPLHWTSCLKIAEDLATGLLYIHQNPGLTHGNIKSSNVLLGSDFESCFTDYGLNPFKNPDTHEESSASSLFYRAPECRDIRKPPTQQSDVYSFGVLLLELLTGKTPFQDLVLEHGSDIPMWVRSVREEETESGDSNDASEEKLGALLNIAMGCVLIGPEDRPLMREVLRMIREMRTEAQVSSNSSDHSPGRWSDTVQSLPREEHLSI